MSTRESPFKKPQIYPSNTYVVLRHGLTQWNEEKRYQGQSDMPLNGRGIVQALAANISFNPDRIIISPLRRTVQTATLALREHVTSFQTDERLLERNGGDFEGRLFSELAIEEEWIDWRTCSRNIILNKRFPNGESELDVIRRTYDLLQELENSYTNELILFVAHAGTNRAISVLIEGGFEESYRKASLKNCQYAVY